MSFCSRDSAHPLRMRNTAAKTESYVLQATPVTLAVVAGPLIAIAYQLMRSPDAATSSFSVAQAARGLLCILMLCSLLLSTGLSLLTHRLVRPLLFLAAYALLTSLAGPHPYEHIVFAVKMAFIAVVFLSALQLATEGLVRERWLTTCAWIVLLTMAACITVGLITGRTAYQIRYATAGLMNHVSVASVFILSTLPVFIRCIAVGRSALAGIAIAYASLFFTMRRSALIAAIVATCCSFLTTLNPLGNRIHWCRTLMPMAILLLLAGIGLSTPAGADLMARFRDLDPQEGTGSGRYIFWKISLEHIMDRPIHAQLSGEGMGCVRSLMKHRFGLAIGSHNDGLDLVYAFGLCGLIGIGWWYFELARFAWCLHNHRNGLFQGTCAAVIILGLISIGTGGSFEPSWALSYAAMGFWAGRAAYA